MNFYIFNVFQSIVVIFLVLKLSQLWPIGAPRNFVFVANSEVALKTMDLRKPTPRYNLISSLQIHKSYQLILHQTQF